jgi:hypothetical protein
MKKTNGDMNRISRLNLTDLTPHLHTTPTALGDIDFFHRIHMTKEFFTGGHRRMGKKHQGLKMPGVQNHVGHAAPVGPIASRFHFWVFQVAFYHRIVLSPSLFPFRNILMKDGGRNQNKINDSQKARLGH